jgi:feruloyl esterase
VVGAPAINLVKVQSRGILVAQMSLQNPEGSVVQAMGGQQATDGFLRLFMVPGMEHCRGGPGPNTFDAVAPLDDWVEHGMPPERIIAAHNGADGKQVDRTRPLCRYPQVARYKGTGSTDEAASFSCQTL